MSASSAWAPVRNPSVGWTAIDREVVVIDERDRVHVLDGTGAALWQLFDGTATLDELAADVAAVFGVTPDAASDDVRAFAERTAALGLPRGSSPMTVDVDEPAPRYLTRPPDP